MRTADSKWSDEDKCYSTVGWRGVGALLHNFSDISMTFKVFGNTSIVIKTKYRKGFPINEIFF